MDISVQYADPVKEDLINPNDWGPLWSNSKRGSNSVGSLVAELGSALEDALVLLSTSAPPLEGCEVRCLEKHKECAELIINQDASLLKTSQPKSGENATSPCSRNVPFSDVPTCGKEKVSNMRLGEYSSLEFGNPTSTSLVSLPTSPKPVSAMKGSREKRGILVGKLSVSWTPDVHDPPVTSQSHTVKSHVQYYSMVNKKSYRRKNKHKAKTHPRGSGSDKKHHHHKTVSRVAGY
ncbi:hypothetical protein U1Q18_020890 [Sarracenia purpurea var. burkii]